MQASERLLSIEEVCELLQVKKSYIYRLTSRSAIPYYRIGGLKFKRSEIEQWMQQNKVKVSSPRTFQQLVNK